jgi:hypothetical protein
VADRATFPFPDELLELQRQLNQARKEHTELCRTLPRSAEPLPGWTREEPSPGGAKPRTVTVEPSPGYAPEQAAAERRLRRRMLELAEQIVTHGFWDTLQREEVAQARTALKHADDKPAREAAGSGEDR